MPPDPASANHVILCLNSGTASFLGLDLDPQKNAVHAEVISTPGSACMAWVIPTNEDLMIARHTRTLLFATAAAQHL